jgi:hypothetical protein
LIHLVAWYAVAVPIAILGLASPLMAALAMSGSSILVTLNALRERHVPAGLKRGHNSERTSGGAAKRALGAAASRRRASPRSQALWASLLIVPVSTGTCVGADGGETPQLQERAPTSG